jgi:ubiquinone/menaquinone biosynthesis C-methylase UbiE
VAEPKNLCGGVFGAVYDFYIEREWLARLVGRAVWGMDVRPMYASMSAIGQLPDHATVLDVPCGGGVAFRAVGSDQHVRYIAVDLSEDMLSRARRRARSRALDQIETLNADMQDLPFPDAIADLCLSYSGLHAIADPQKTVAEMVRCLKPGGELVGTMFLLEGSRRQRFLLQRGQRRGEFGTCGTGDDLLGWLADAGLRNPTIEPKHGFVIFRGRKSSADT